MGLTGFSVFNEASKCVRKTVKCPLNIKNAHMSPVTIFIEKLSIKKYHVNKIL